MQFSLNQGAKRAMENNVINVQIACDDVFLTSIFPLIKFVHKEKSYSNCKLSFKI